MTSPSDGAGHAARMRAAIGEAVAVAPQGAEAGHLQHVLAELMGCGSGYLAGRCDAA